MERGRLARFVAGWKPALPVWSAATVIFFKRRAALTQRDKGAKAQRFFYRVIMEFLVVVKKTAPALGAPASSRLVHLPGLVCRQDAGAPSFSSTRRRFAYLIGHIAMADTGESMTFEVAFKRLEKIVAQLESATLPLDDVITQYEAGMRLLAVCGEQLAVAEKKIELLTQQRPGQWQHAELDAKVAADGAPAAPPEKKGRGAGEVSLF
jgi:exodeoxyribonuclease VII small subunit